MCIGKSIPDKCILPKGSYIKSMRNLLLSKGDEKNIVCSNVCKTLTGPGQANLQKVESSTTRPSALGMSDPIMDH